MKASSLKKGRERREKEPALCLQGTSLITPFSHQRTLATPHYLSARTSKGLVPSDQLRTIQAESIAARKPRAIPVPIGQKGYYGDIKQRIKINYLSKERG